MIRKKIITNRICLIFESKLINLVRTSLLIGLLLGFIGNGLAQKRELIPKQHLTITQGLGHNGVTSIIEDSRGFLWIGTYDGLNKYDGYDFEVYKNTVEEQILTSNRVRTLQEDTKGNLWIGTDEGISIYNYQQATFHTIYPQVTGNKAIIRNILVNPHQGQILCLTESDGLLLFNEDYELIDHFIPSSTSEAQPINFRQGVLLEESTYLLATTTGLFTFNVVTKDFLPVLPNVISYGSSLVKLDKNNLLVAKNTGVALLELTKTNKTYRFKVLKTALNNDAFRYINIDAQNAVWLGTSHKGIKYASGIETLFNEEDKVVTFLPKSRTLRVSHIMPSPQHGIWVSTFDQGVYRFDELENPFNSISLGDTERFELESSSFLHIIPKDSNQLYLTSTRRGVAVLNTVTKELSKLTLQKQPISVRSLVFKDSREDLWLLLVDKEGLYRWQTKEKKLERVLSSQAGESYRGIQEDNHGNIWVNARTSIQRIGIQAATGAIKKIDNIKSHPKFKVAKGINFRTLYPDTLAGFIWLGTSTNGLYKIENPLAELADLSIQNYQHDRSQKQSISSNSVTSIVRLSNGELWIGTERGGICKVVTNDKISTFTSFTEKQGLSNNVVKSILPDDENNLWVATNIGLNKFDTKTFQFKSFHQEDGLPFEDFWYATTKLANGAYIFSGIHNLCFFQPNQIPKVEPLPQLAFGKFKLFDETIAPNDSVNGRILLPTPLVHDMNLNLKYYENSISLDLTALHYAKPHNHYLRYKLSPINKDWIKVPSDQSTFYFSGLHPGKYELKAAASNATDKWTEPITLNITISPPWWKTNLAYFLYCLATGLISYAVFYYTLKMQKLQHNLELEQLEKNTAKEINAAKLRFFSNISHEIKTPLTLIYGPIALLQERFSRNKEISDKLELVQRQTRKMLQLVNQVHDFQRAGANQLTLKPEVFSFDQFMQELEKDFTFLSKNDKKELTFRGTNSEIFVSADKDKLEKIFNNLLNNAFKHTRLNDTIEVAYQAKDGQLFVQVSDTGRGIHADDLPHIFKRFYQTQQQDKNSSGGAGIGLTFTKRLVEMHDGIISAKSEWQQGTTFYLQLPILAERPVAAAVPSEELPKRTAAKLETILSTNDYDLSNVKVAEEFKGATVYFVEDDSDMRQFVSNVLANFFKVKTFPNGASCWEMMEKEWPNLVITDIEMPEVNGFELCKRIKSDIKTSHIPVILLTASSTIDKKIYGISEGADAYLEKPFNIRHLVTRIEALLHNRQLLRERFRTDFPVALEKKSTEDEDTLFLEKLHQLMEENLDNQDLNLDYFAKELYLNRTHFYQKVKALTNHTPFELLKNYRLRKAAEFLVQQQLSVKEVFMRTGFKSRTHFSKLFKEKYEVSPGKYAATMRQKFENRKG